LPFSAHRHEAFSTELAAPFKLGDQLDRRAQGNDFPDWDFELTLARGFGNFFQDFGARRTDK
jgi:hypothetical protein